MKKTIKEILDKYVEVGLEKGIPEHNLVKLEDELIEFVKIAKDEVYEEWYDWDAGASL